jgi:hypothetical protein
MFEQEANSLHYEDGNSTDMTHAPQPNDSPGFIPPHGGYDKLKSYQMSVLVDDATVKFCDRFIDPKSRTHDQMVQAARSGNKNMAEGSQGRLTSFNFSPQPLP